MKQSCLATFSAWKILAEIFLLIFSGRNYQMFSSRNFLGQKLSDTKFMIDIFSGWILLAKNNAYKMPKIMHNFPRKYSDLYSCYQKGKNVFQVWIDKLHCYLLLFVIKMKFLYSYQFSRCKGFQKNKNLLSMGLTIIP